MMRTAIAAALCVLLAASAAQSQQSQPAPPQKMIGMYVHQHWSYNHPYCARTWTLEDWRGYVTALHAIGYNTVLIWPVIETMPEPLTDSDRASLDKIAKVIDLVHDELGMRAYFVICPNIAPNPDEAPNYTFEQRPFFGSSKLVDPGDPVAFGKLMAWREQVCRPLAKADGVFIIDSDPGGWPNSTNLEFVSLLGAHRRMLDRLRPGIELYYWIAQGWEGYGRFHATGKLQQSTPEEYGDCLHLLAKQKYEPWGLAVMPNVKLPEGLGMDDRMMNFNYGAIEGEPSFPMTRFNDGYAYKAGANGAARGVMGNSQTHAVQLPNAFAFVRAAQGLPCEEADYVTFADGLIPGQGAPIVEGWKALQGSDAARMAQAADQLAAIPSASLKPGPLGGFLFGEPARFIDDLVKQLRAGALVMQFHAAVFAEPQDKAKVVDAFARFVDAIEAWQTKHAYKNCWYWEPMNAALRKLDRPKLNEALDALRLEGDGATPFERVKNGLRQLETYTPRLLDAMKAAVAEMRKEQAEGK